jgi:DNA-binding response OmpR family regulator
MESVLLIDDDVELCSMLGDYLGRHGFRITAIHRGDTGLNAAKEKPWALVLLDVMLPGMDGFEVLKQLRGASPVRVLLLTARGDDVDRIVGLEIGADDYLAKPFNPRELLARMRAILRRSGATEFPGTSAILRVDDLELDPGARTVLTKGKSIELTDVEFSLLEALMRSPGKVVSREELAAHALGRSLNAFDRSLDMHVSRLRRKLDEVSSSGDRIKTIRGAGYQLLVYRAQLEGRS